MGVTDLCDHPPEAGAVLKVSRSRLAPDLSSAQVEARMQELRDSGEAAFELDWQALARERPCLVLTQSTCAACDPAEDAALQVRPTPVPGQGWTASPQFAGALCYIAGM